jgi:hypothetical protein
MRTAFVMTKSRAPSERLNQERATTGIYDFVLLGLLVGASGKSPIPVGSVQSAWT